MRKIENDLSQGKVLNKLILFALPFLASNFIQSLYNIADMLVIGHFAGTESMAGVNIGGQVTFILTNVIIGLCMGGTVLIGQYMGAKNEEKLKKVITTLITLLVILSFVVTTVMLFLRKPVLHLLRTPPEAFAESERYLTVTLTGILFIFGYNALAAILRGMGNSKQPFYFITIACIVNIILNFIFVAGLKWGAFGAAFTTVLSQALSVILCVRYMVKNNFQFDFKLRSYKIYKEQLKLIIKIGLPTSIQNSIVGISFAFITAIVNIVGGVTAAAGVGAAGRFNSFAFMPILAMSASISAMAAQNFGAQRIDRAVSACRIGTVFSVIVSFSFFALVMLYPSGVLRIFGSDPQMISDGAVYLRSFAFDFLLIPFIFCINGLLIGGGHTFFTFVTGVLSSVLLRVPACYFFGVTLGWGLSGIGLGAPIASAGVLLIIIGYLISGKWKHNVIRHDYA
jgi:putative MATE family efflux protein